MTNAPQANRPDRRRVMRRALALGALGASALGAGLPAVASAAPLSGVDLSSYVRVGRYDLPEPTRTTAPSGNLLAQEASGITYNWDTGTFFIVGDGSTSVVQVDGEGHLIDSMTLPAGGSPQGTEFYDTEGIAYLGGGKFAFTEERNRQLVRFTYAAGTTLQRSQTETVKLGTTIGNIGLEGFTNDPISGGLVVVKESGPIGIFQTDVDWANGTATNGSPTTENSTNLFDPALAGLGDFSDAFSLANLSGLTGPERDNLIIISQESGKVVNISRSGVVSSSLTLNADLDTTISIPDQTHEGVTMDDEGNLYVVSENGGGDINHPQMWKYAPATQPNQAPTQVALINTTASLAENTPTPSRLKVADVRTVDDGLGTNGLSVSGADASAFEVDRTGLYLKAGTVLDYETKSTYNVTVDLDDTTVGSTPDASTTYQLTITDLPDSGTGSPSLAITEVAPWGSGNGTYAADWFELTNTGASAVDLTGYKMDDGSNTIGSAVALNGVSVLAPGESAIFLEGNASVVQSYKNQWFGGAAPAGLQVGSYSGSGVGLSTGGDAVAVFDATGARITGVAFGASTDKVSFDNAAGAGSATTTLPTISTLSQVGVKGAFQVGAEIGSPGRIRNPLSLRVTEVSPWSSGNSPYGADWFELTNTGTTTADITGFKMDDDSGSFATAVALTGITAIAPGESVVFSEGSAAIAGFKNHWFGGSVPSGFQMGSYSGGVVGLSTGGDSVNIFDASGNRVTGVRFGSSTAGFTFDNAAGAGSTTTPLPLITTLSVNGASGAYVATGEVGSPGTITRETTAPVITFSGGLPTYTVDDTIAITCTAVDEPRGSGIVSTDCADITGPAADLGVGPHSYAATAIDAAGNIGTATVSFEVTASTTSVCLLQKHMVKKSAAYLALTNRQKTTLIISMDTNCKNRLNAFSPKSTPAAQARNARLVEVFEAQAGALRDQGYLTQPQVDQLVSFAAYLGRIPTTV